MQYLGSISNDADLVNKKYVDDNVSLVASLAAAALPNITSITVTSSGWSSGVQNVTVTGMTSTAAVIVAPDPVNIPDWTDNGVVCDSQSTDTLTFLNDEDPTVDIDVNVMFWGD